LTRTDPRSPKTSLYVSDYKFFHPVKKKDEPPYPSVSTYDSKVWKLVQQHGRSGDMIWNVAG
jgi:hypothetical protein